MNSNENIELNKIIDEISKIEITPLNILNVCLVAMKKVETFPKLKGEEKKKLVLKAIEIVIEKTNLDNSVLNFIPSFIDNIISVEKGELKIKEKITKSLCCCFDLCIKK